MVSEKANHGKTWQNMVRCGMLWYDMMGVFDGVYRICLWLYSCMAVWLYGCIAVCRIMYATTVSLPYLTRCFAVDHDLDR